jgi:Flp pilus assembly protein TadG
MTARVPARRHDEGSATVQAVLTVPLLGLLVFTIVQFALYFHALQIAQTAANQGLDAARVAGATDSAGQARSDAYLAALAGGVLHDGQARVRRTAGRVEVHVTGTAEQVVPFLRLPIGVTATGPVEQVGTR